jgi:hypothetical protein
VRRATRLPQASSEAELLDEADYLRVSLADLDREHASGELDGADYEALWARYSERVASVEDALERLSAAPAQPTAARHVVRRPGADLSGAVEVGAPPAGVEQAAMSSRGGAKRWLATRRHRMVFGWSAAGCFAVAATLVGLSLAGVAPFASSPPATLSVSSEIRIELAEAGVLASNKELVQAVAVYDRVLELDPEQPEALADGGWLVRLAGLSSKSSQVISGGDAEIAAAVKVAPGYALARAYDGVALFEDDHSATAAVGQFGAMLADKPTSTLVESVRSVALEAYGAAGVAVPATLGASPSAATG